MNHNRLHRLKFFPNRLLGLGMALAEHRLPRWIKPQLTRLAEEAPKGTDWLHEIKYDGYRMHARIDGDETQLLTRTGLDWSHRYKRTLEALRSLKVKSGQRAARPAEARRDEAIAHRHLARR
jgi:hypothetical protein